MESTHRRLCNLQLLKILFLLGVLFAFTGCSALISGYNSEFQCPNTNKGKCVSVQTAYKESLEGRKHENNPLVKENSNGKCEGEEGSHDKDHGDNAKPAIKEMEYGYQNALYKKLSSLIGQPSTPLVVPPDVMTVLILSYTGTGNELFSYRYVYFFATEPKWVISTAKEAQ